MLRYTYQETEHRRPSKQPKTIDKMSAPAGRTASCSAVVTQTKSRTLGNWHAGQRRSQAATSAAAAASMSIEVVEVGDDDRNRKCYGEYAGDDAHGADQLAPDTDRCDVTVADGRHGDDCPPERTRY